VYVYTNNKDDKTRLTVLYAVYYCIPATDAAHQLSLYEETATLSVSNTRDGVICV